MTWNAHSNVHTFRNVTSCHIPLSFKCDLGYLYDLRERAIDFQYGPRWLLQVGESNDNKFRHFHKFWVVQLYSYTKKIIMARIYSPKLKRTNAFHVRAIRSFYVEKGVVHLQMSCRKHEVVKLTAEVGCDLEEN